MKNMYRTVLVFAFLTFFVAQTKDQVILTEHNHVALFGEITADTADTFLQDASRLTTLYPRYVYINSPGGSVRAGNRIVRHIMQHNYTCIAEVAISMAFVILQSCRHRSIMYGSIVMQHQQSLMIDGDIERINNYMRMANAINKDLIALQATRLGISEHKFKSFTMNEWWLYGQEIIDNGVADRMIDVRCNDALYNKTRTIQKHNVFGNLFNITHSLCPLVHG